MKVQISIYARREPTTDSIWLMYHEPGSKRPWDVQVYRNSHPFKEFEYGRFMWWMKNKPKRSQKYVFVNCFRFRIFWMPDLIVDGKNKS